MRFFREYHVSREIIATNAGNLNPDILQLQSSIPGQPNRFFVRTEWEEQLPIPLSFRSIRLANVAPKYVYAPFPNFDLIGGGIDSWLEWRDVTLPSVGLAKVLAVAEGVDLDLLNTLDTHVRMTINTRDWLQILVLTDKTNSSTRSPPNVTLDVETPIKECFGKFGREWMEEIIGAVGRRNRNDFFRQRDADNVKKMAEQEKEIQILRQGGNPYSQPWQPPPPPPPTPVYTMPQNTPKSKRKKVIEEDDDSESSDSDSESRKALVKAMAKMTKRLAKK